MRITANVRPEFGLHGLFKLTRKVSTVVPNKGSIVSPIFFVLILYEFVHSVFKDGKTLGSGVVCLRELMRKQEHAMAVEQTETGLVLRLHVLLFAKTAVHIFPLPSIAVFCRGLGGVGPTSRRPS